MVVAIKICPHEIASIVTLHQSLSHKNIKLVLKRKIIINLLPKAKKIKKACWTRNQIDILATRLSTIMTVK